MKRGDRATFCGEPCVFESYHTYRYLRDFTLVTMAGTGRQELQPSEYIIPEVVK